MDVKRDTIKVIWMKMILLIAPLVIVAMSFMVSLAKDYTSTGTTLAVLLIMLLANYQVFSSLYPILAKITLDEEKLTIKYPFWGREKSFNYSQLKGFKKQVVPLNFLAKFGLLLYTEDGKVAELSPLFITNIPEIEDFLQTKTNNLGKEPFRLFKTVWDRLFWRY
ncbi:MAG: hypothetical protein RIG68_14885 [Imperialibacter sp.]|uniref:hypothetical protein n=1 Tax=Imperialibacter sp. TaxID=2038411 RepID=UPI0032EF4DA7